MKQRGDSDEDAPHEAERPIDTVEDASFAIRCARCRARVARPSDRVERFGALHHDRVNPAGFVFRLSCFEAAPGARAHGPPSLEFAWFPRAPWQVACCAACGHHLGWYFGGEGPFWGLSVDAIVEGTDLG